MSFGGLLSLNPSDGSKTISKPESLTKLTQLYLSDRQLNCIPHEIRLLTGLQFLDLSNNLLSALPESMRSLCRLTELNLANNRMNELPDCLKTMTALVNLYIFGNWITSLPMFICGFKYLRRLVIVNANHDTKVEYAPVGIMDLPCWYDTSRWEDAPSNGEFLQKLLRYSTHSDERLDNVSRFIRGWKYCHKVDISCNHIVSLPSEMRTLTLLTELNLSNNRFQEFPSVLTEMTWLQSLDISNNKITSLPSQFANLTNLETFKISHFTDTFSLLKAPISVTSLPFWNNISNHDKWNLVDDRLNLSSRPFVTQYWPPEDRGDGSRTIPQDQRKITNPVRASLLCPNCFELNHEPLLLGCNHMICKTCGEDCMSSKDPYTFKCPICDKDAPLPQQTQDVRERLDSHRSKLMQAKFSVQLPTELFRCKAKDCVQEAYFECRTCGYFCAQHRTFHDRINQDHIVSVVAPRFEQRSFHIESLCPEHDVELEYFCAEDSVKVLKCTKCLIDDLSKEKSSNAGASSFPPKEPPKIRDQLKDLEQRLNKEAKNLTDKLHKVEEDGKGLAGKKAEYEEWKMRHERKITQSIQALQNMLDEINTLMRQQLRESDDEFQKQYLSRARSLERERRKVSLSRSWVHQSMTHLPRASLGNVALALKVSKPGKDEKTPSLELPDRKKIEEKVKEFEECQEAVEKFRTSVLKDDESHQKK